MNKTKLLQVLHALSIWELRHLRQFLESPFFNKRKDVLQLLDFLFDARKKDITINKKEQAWQVVYPEKAFDDTQMDLLLSRLYKLVEQFLATRQMLEDKILVKTNLAKAYRNMKLEKPFKKTIRDSQKMLEAQPIRNTAFLRRQYEVEYAFYDYIASQRRSKETNLQEVTNALDTYYLASKLKQSCLQISHLAVYKKNYEFGLKDEVMNYLEKREDLLEYPAIAIYYYCYKAITEKEGGAFFEKLRQLTESHQHEFEATELRDIYILAINYAIRQTNLGKKHFRKETFEMYRAGVEQGILMENQVISPFTFNNAVTLGLQLKEYVWVENFIQNFRNNLTQQYRQSYYNYNLAKLRFEQNDYKEAMRLLIKVDDEDYLLMLGAKDILRKIYYETEEFDALDSLLESMRVYLQRKEVLGYHREHFSMLVQCTKRLMELAPYDTKNKARLMERIQQIKVESDRNWLIQQLGSK